MRPWSPILAFALLVGCVGVASPARAADPKTFAEYEQAMTALREEMKAASGWEVGCDQEAAPLLISARMVYAASEASFHYTIGTKSNPQVSSWITYASTERWAFKIEDGTPFGFSDSLRAPILKRAKLSNDIEYVSGPFAPWAARYIVQDDSNSFPSIRSSMPRLAEQFAVRPETASPTLSISYVSLGGLAGKWFLTDNQTPTIDFATLVIGPDGLLESSDHWSMTDGVETSRSTCSVTVTSQPVPDTPSATITAPLRKLGPAAWRVSNSALATDIAADVAGATKASGQRTPARLRGQTWITLAARELQDTWTVTELPRGVRVSLTDPWGGTVARCLEVKKGKIRSSKC